MPLLPCTFAFVMVGSEQRRVALDVLLSVKQIKTEAEGAPQAGFWRAAIVECPPPGSENSRARFLGTVRTPH